MRGRWVEFVRVGSMVVGAFLLLQLVVVLLDAASRGWPGGAEYMYVILASVLGSTSEFMPVGVLVGAAVAARRRGGAAAASAGGVLLAGSMVVLLTFILDGFLGPHLLHYARLTLLPEPGGVAPEHPTAIAIRDMQPNDWLFFLSRLSATKAAASVDALRTMEAVVHSGIAFPLLTGLMLPLGLAVGGTHATGDRPRRIRWAMLAATTMLVYAPQMATWYLAIYREDALPSARWIYGGYLIVPIAMLLAVGWARGAGHPGSGAPESWDRGPA